MAAAFALWAAAILLLRLFNFMTLGQGDRSEESLPLKPERCRIYPMTSNESNFMRGKITSGLGQAQHFLSREGYCRQFEARLGYVPFPGTLNILLDEPFPTEAPSIEIEGFREGDKSFGCCRCYHIKINGIDAAVVRPERSCHPPELIEVIAPVHLRRALRLVDGDSVSIILL